MSDAGPVQITSGGAVAVDTDSLRHAADRFHGVARQLDDVSAALRRECARLRHGAGSWSWALSGRVFAVGDTSRAVGDHADRLGGALAHAADVYELIELRIATEQARAAGHVQAQQRAIAAMDALIAADPRLPSEANQVLSAYGREVAAEERHVGASLPIVGGIGFTAVELWGRGRMFAGTTGPPPPPVRVHQVGATVAGRPPTDLAEVVGRIPTGDRRPLVRVERYTMPDASHRFMVYVTGTRDAGPLRGTDPSDMTSNLRLYAGRSSASLVAVQRALEAAGARPGDIVNPVGHSQGGMIAGRLALDGGYRTTMLVTAGSPTEAQVSPDVLSVQLEHPDVVSDLNGGGSAGQVGAAGSVVIRRELRPDGGPLAAHDLSRYVETAREAVGSGDPRLANVHEQLAALKDATSVDVREYDAELVADPHPPVPHPIPVPDPRSVPGVDGPFVGADRG